MVEEVLSDENSVRDGSYVPNNNNSSAINITGNEMFPGESVKDTISALDSAQPYQRNAPA